MLHLNIILSKFRFTNIHKILFCESVKVALSR